jgi:branched-chain amino acid transport system substrate-binding protein
VATVGADYGPGIEAEKAFSERLVKNGGQIAEAIRVPLRNPEFAPSSSALRTPSLAPCSSSCQPASKASPS